MERLGAKAAGKSCLAADEQERVLLTAARGAFERSGREDHLVGRGILVLWRQGRVTMRADKDDVFAHVMLLLVKPEPLGAGEPVEAGLALTRHHH